MVVSFLPFLPSDDVTGIRDPVAEEALQLINVDLEQLLQQDASQFWETVLHDDSLHTCIDTYLRFKRRVHDSKGDAVKGASLLEQQLARRVFMVLLRMVNTAETGKGVPSSSQKAQWLYDQRVLDVPKLMDVATLYGPANPALTQQLISNVLQLQPLYLDEVHVLVRALSANLQALQERTIKCIDETIRGESGRAQALLDAVAYMKDMCVTLGSFIGCYPPMAGLLLQLGQGQLLSVLAALHDRLLPRLVSVLGQDTISKGCSVSSADAVLQAQGAAAGIQQLTMQLLSLAYLTQLPSLPTPGQGGSSSGCASGSGAAGGSGSSFSAAAGGSSSRAAAGGSGSGSGSSHSSAWQAAGGNSSSAGTASLQGTSQLDAEQRGTGLMTAVMCASHIEGGGAAADVADAHLLRSMNERFGFDVTVACAMQQGLIVLDETQFDYLLALLESHDPSRVQVAASVRLSTAHASPSPASSSAAASSSAGKKSSAGPSSSQAAALPEPAVLASLITQIKDLMGDAYGDGYLTACLHAYSYNVEHVLNALLDGSLKPELKALDVNLISWKPPVPAPASTSGSSTSWTTAMGDAAAFRQQEALAAASRASKVITSATQQSNGIKAQMHRGVARVLGKLDQEAKAATKVLANELQWEYDDEYDDSYDDLLRTGADGVADVEGDDAASGTKAGQGALEEVQQPRRPVAAPAATRASATGPGSSLAAEASRGTPSNSSGAAVLAGPPARAPLVAAGGGPSKVAQGRGRGKPNRMWILDGRVYNYAKEGATEVSGQQEADQAIKAAIEAKQAIHGLGAGGNKGAAQSRWTAIHEAASQASGTGTRQPTSSSGGALDRHAVDGDDNADDGQVSEQARTGAGRGQRSYARKEQNKAAVANHHRKDRAFKKMGF